MLAQKETEKPGLRNCNLCGKGISPYSAFCRNCGHPQKTVLVIWLLGIFLVMMIAFYITMTLFCACNVQKLKVFPDTPELHEGSGSVYEPYRREE